MPPPLVIEFVDPHLAEDQQKKIVSKYNFFGFIDKIAIFSGGAAPPWPPAGYGPGLDLNKPTHDSKVVLDSMGM